MLLPIANLLIDLSIFSIGALRGQLSDPANTIAQRLQYVLIAASIISGAVIVALLASHTTPQALNEICGAVTVCATPTP